jgi:hypothetical protein
MRREVRITPKVFGPMGSAHFLPSLLNFAAPVDVADNATCVWRRMSLEASALPGLREYALLGRAARPFRRGLRLVEPPSGPPVAETDPATLADYGRWDKFRAGHPLDLTGAVLTFADEFDRPSITGPDGDGPWFAPIHGGFGLAAFLPPYTTEPPFYFDNGVLTIRLAKRDRRWTLYFEDGSLRVAKRDGRWTSRILQSVNADGEGFTQRYGYFELRAKFPKGADTWPAFWLKSLSQLTDWSQTRAEIDIIEAYGGNDWSGYHAAVHLWPARNPGLSSCRSTARRAATKGSKAICSTATGIPTAVRSARSW